jgi:hypothetical protein
LPDHSLWRRETKGCADIVLNTTKVDSYSEIHVQTLSTNSAELVVKGFSRIVSSKVSKLVARSKMIEQTDDLIPLAKLEGRAQTIGLTALAEVLKFGGVRGDILSPVSIAQYTSTIFLKFVGQLITLDGAEEASSFEVAYQKIIKTCIPTQQGKAAALLQALHNRLILRGAPPLNHPISTKTPQIIPAAAVIWPHELELAKEYVLKSGAENRVKKQALLCLQLGSEIPLRSYDYFSFRLRDILRDGASEVVVAPTRSADKDKSIHAHMRHEISNPDCITSLQEFKQMRLIEEELPDGSQNLEIPMFSKPGQRGVYKQWETMVLINAGLKWATGNPTASLYDLRHTVISTRALNVLTNLLLQHVAEGMLTKYVMGAHSINEDELNLATEAAERSWIKATPMHRTHRERRLWLRDYFECSRDSKQQKFRLVIAHLEKLIQEDKWGRLRQIYRAAFECIDTHEIDLARGHYSLEILQLLLDSGCNRSQLLIKCNDIKSPVVKELKARCGNVYPQSPRRGRAMVRLFLLPNGTSRDQASGATISISGLYWLLCVLGCLLYVRGEY